MKIYDYYRQAANLSLNGSIAALVPVILITACNLSFFQNRQIMLLTIPFLAYSLVSFQIYLFKINRSFQIERNMALSKSFSPQLISSHLVIVYLNSLSPRLQLYFPNGCLGGEIKPFRPRGLRFWSGKWYAFYNGRMEKVGFFKVKGKAIIEINVYDENNNFLGFMKKMPLSWKKSKKELYDSSRRLVGEITGSAMFMDEQILNESNEQVGRLRRGWMPLEWEKRFPEPNTPVLTFKEKASKKEKLLMMSVLINEYFIER